MLRKNEWQYQVNYESVDDFKVGEFVFLKSNPKVYLVVAGFNGDEVLLTYTDLMGVFHKISIHFKCLMHYRNAALLVYDGNYNVCLN